MWSEGVWRWVGGGTGVGMILHYCTRGQANTNRGDKFTHSRLRLSFLGFLVFIGIPAQESDVGERLPTNK